MKVADVVPAFIVACPSISPAWQQYLEFWHGEPERGHFNDAGVVAHHLVDSFERGDLSEFPTAFALLERCLGDGDQQAKELAVIGIIEDIQNIASHRPFGPSVFYEWLGPQSRSAWDDLCDSWRRIAEAKAAGLLDSLPDQPSAPPVDSSEIEDPTLRRMIESLYRGESRG